MAGGAFEAFEEDLREKGYAVVPGVLTDEEVGVAKESFRGWVEGIPGIQERHRAMDAHGIFRHYEAGHQWHAWYIRTRLAVQNVFKKLWRADDLAVSFDGCCWIDAGLRKADTVWTHTDQAPGKRGVHCYQGFVSLTSNKERTLVVYEGSHKLHEPYMRSRGLSGSKDWQKIDAEYLEGIKGTRRALEVEAGSLVLWDSRTFHQNQYGQAGEERIVQYVSYLPRDARSTAMKRKREKYFRERRTTSHWPYPVRVNGLQPQVFGDKSKLIDYSGLAVPRLEGLEEQIEALI